MTTNYGSSLSSYAPIKRLSLSPLQAAKIKTQIPLTWSAKSSKLDFVNLLVGHVLTGQ